MKVPRTLAIISETLDWFKYQFDSITKIGIRILVELLKVKQVTKESSLSPFIIIIMIIVIILSVSIMIFVIMFVFVLTMNLGYLVYLTPIQPYSSTRRTIINRCFVPLHLLHLSLTFWTLHIGVS